MNKKLLVLALRRESLVLETEQQRMQLAHIVDTWRAPLALADQGLAAIRFIRKHPIWMASCGAFLLKLLRPSRLGKWFQRGLMVWQVIKRLRG
jgi:hypothetical protein